MKKINPLNVNDLVVDLFDVQTASVDQFSEDFSEVVLGICESIRNCYAAFLCFENHDGADEQFQYLTAHVYAQIQSLYTSVKLLVHGFVAPSGNQFRGAIEATALAILLSCRRDLLVKKTRKKWTASNFYEDLRSGKRWTQPHLAMNILIKNKEQLGLTAAALDLLENTRKLYNDYSHASLLSIRAVIISHDRVLFGGGYEHDQKELFEIELNARKGFIEKAPSLLGALYKRSVS
jgi:hypothetical protein